ncbi:MAG: trypsin-like peptidase domain-containing protein [Dehalococcoidia bacterium]|nr:trypsin-like peptidase domain-containing protein [Dehalococcoidia bacterium]MYD29929.1 trypsin-like peptidase domain-containing protein [Dehalococcoidia bacterium]
MTALDAIKQRTFPVKYRNRDGDLMSGTAFVIDHQGKEYLVTAHHIVTDDAPSSRIEVFHGGKWIEEWYTLVGLGPVLSDRSSKVDVAVLKLWNSLPTGASVAVSSAGLVDGQVVHILGFPTAKSAFSTVTVVTGTFTGFRDEESCMHFEAEATKGMSGGPVVFVPEGQSSSEPRIAGVVAHIPSTPCSVPLPSTMAAYDIRRAIDLI